MSAAVWTPERLEWMRDVGLPASRTLDEALQRGARQFGIGLPGVRRFQLQFKRAFGSTIGEHLAVTEAPADHVKLRQQIRRLQDELRQTQEEAVTAREIRSVLRRAAEHVADPPEWLTETKSAPLHGTPTLFLSDVHYSETVNAAEVHGANRYNSQIAADRLERVFQKATHLFTDILANGKYPGVVLALGGDMLSGTIHDEIRESNDMATAHSVLRLADLLVAGIRMLRERFGRVFVPCVVGNHSRLDRKPRAKGAPGENLEYLLYHLVASRFDGDKKVTFHVSESLQCHYRVYGTRYLLVHGDGFRGGSGITGPLTPWTLGDHRLRKQASSMSAWRGTPSYDVLLFGHWHTLFFGGSFVANGCVKGFDEYALRCGFAYEPARQAAWLTHPDYGITLTMPVYADRSRRTGKKPTWVEVPSD